MPGKAGRGQSQRPFLGLAERSPQVVGAMGLNDHSLSETWGLRETADVRGITGS